MKILSRVSVVLFVFIAATVLCSTAVMAEDFFSNTEIYLAPGDDLLITYTNTDASTWGLTVVWGDA